MKFSKVWTLLLIAALTNGCVLFHHRAKPAPTAPAGAPAAPAAPPVALHPIVTPDNSLTATVADYNAAGRFVVLSFPVRKTPQMGQTLFLYRAGLKIGEVKVTGPQQDSDIVADLVSGTAQVGDEVREQ